MCLGRAEVSRPVLRDSAANKRRCNSVTVSYLCSNPSKAPEKPGNSGKKEIRAFAAYDATNAHGIGQLVNTAREPR
jgi:hypothetical protein